MEQSLVFLAKTSTALSFGGRKLKHQLSKLWIILANMQIFIYSVKRIFRDVKLSRASNGGHMKFHGGIYT